MTLLFFIGFLFFAIPGLNQSPAVADDSLVASWMFDEGAGTMATDSSGYGNTGTLNGPTWTGSGKVNGALVFDGVNDRVQIPNSASLATVSSQITAAAWVYLTDTSGAWYTVMHRTNASGNFLDFQMHARAAGPPYFVVNWSNSSGADAVVYGDITL